MRNYWDNLNERERLLVIIGGACLLIFVLYQFLYSPLITRVAEAKRDLQEKKGTLTWMQEMQHKAIKRTPQQAVDASKLLSIIATELNARPFSNFPHHIQLTSQGSIQLSFEKVPYHDFLTWVWKLENTYTITLQQLDATQTETSGLIKLMVLIDVNS